MNDALLLCLGLIVLGASILIWLLIREYRAERDAWREHQDGDF